MQSSLNPSDWRNPPVEYRPVPFWVWNEAQEPKELRRQVREMKAHGCGGFFMHSRVGLKTPYLGEEWFEHVRICTAEAARLGMQAWIYDEDRWPSGFAGGHIADVEGLDFPAQSLFCREVDGERVFTVERAPRTADFNGAAAVDVLNPEVIAAFIRLTHEEYERVIGDQFGKAVPGTFTDEPSYVPWGKPNLSASGGGPNLFGMVPWTGRMEQEFKARRGYALKPHLACLFFDEDTPPDTGETPVPPSRNTGETPVPLGYRRVRMDFYRTVTELFVEAYSQQIYEWCEQRGIVATGHMMMEAGLVSETQAVGASMAHYEWMQIPGIDHLAYFTYHSAVLPKQCASVASQLGGRRVLSELWGGSGWERTPAELKPAGDWDLALGVNLVNQHLGYYSIRGRRKRDYPAGCCYQIPGYDLYKPFNEYWARLSYALTRGKAERRVLLLHPQHSGWALYTPLDKSKCEALDAVWQELNATLLQTQRDYDLGEELILERHARVEGGELIVGDMRYRAVVVPSAESWTAHTLGLLRELVAQGGLVVAVEPVARFVDGVEAAELAEFFAGPGVVRVKRPTVAALEQALAPVAQEVRVSDEAGQAVRELIYMHRACGEQELYFLTFGQAERPLALRVSLEGEGRVERWEAQTGAVEAVPAEAREGRTEFSVELPPRGSVLVALDRTRRPARAAARVTPRSQPLSGAWQVTRLDPNALLLDQAAVRFGDSPWSASMGMFGGGAGTASLPNVEDTVMLAHELYHIWKDWPVHLRFEFGADLPKAAQVIAGVVTENAAALTDWLVNGRPAALQPGQWWLDRQFAKFDATGLLQAGRNRIECQVHWRPPLVPGTMLFTADGTEIDNSYLVGDFHVTRKGKNGFALAPAGALPSDPAADLAGAGLPFYAGKLRYDKTLKLAAVEKGRRYLLRFPTPGGDGLRVAVNGKAARELWCAPWEVDVTRLLRAGENGISVELFTNPGNLLGPLHNVNPWSDIAHRKDGYLLKRVGLGGRPELVF